MSTDNSSAPSLPPRIALLSIAGFWTFYFAILTVRAILIYRDHLFMLNRAIVSLISAGITVVFYLLLRRVAPSDLRRSIVAAALLALPATILYSSINWYVFDHVEDRHPFSWAWSESAKPATVAGQTADAPAVTAPPVPPAPPQAVTVGKMQDDHMTPLATIADRRSTTTSSSRPGRHCTSRYAMLRPSACSSDGRRRLAPRPSRPNSARCATRSIRISCSTR